MIDIETGKVKDFIKFGVGNLCMITGGRNNGRVGTITHQEKHKGSFEIIHVRDAAGARGPPTLPSHGCSPFHSSGDRVVAACITPGWYIEFSIT